MVEQRRKYGSIKELAEAFASGELSRDDWIVDMDNDNATLRWRGSCPEGVDEDDFADSKYEEGKTLWRGDGYSDVADAFIAAGIPCEWV